jgi:HEAT repeat protein
MTRLRALLVLCLPVSFLFLASIATAAPAPMVVDDATVARLVAEENVASLKAIGAPALPVLAALYTQGDEAQRTRLARMYEQLGLESQAAETALLQDAGTQNVELRLAVQSALGRVSGSSDVVDTLLDILRNDPNPLFRDRAASALAYDQIHLGTAGKDRLYAGLIDALADDDAQVRAVTIQALSILTRETKGYDAMLSEERRERSIELWRKWLAEHRSNGTSGTNG